jgi:uncharacterized protein with PIN domain
MTDDISVTDMFECGECNHEEPARIDAIVGEKITKTVGTGRRATEITTVVCPECGSEDWYSRSIRDAFGDALNNEKLRSIAPVTR